MVNYTNCFFYLVLKEQASWPLIDTLAEAGASNFHNQAIKYFTEIKFGSTITYEPVVPITVDRGFLNIQKLVDSSHVTK